MGQIAQIAEHARILHSGLLARLVTLIVGVWADQREDALEQRRGKSCTAVHGACWRQWIKGWVEPKGGIIIAVDALGFLLLPTEPLHPDSFSWNVWMLRDTALIW